MLSRIGQCALAAVLIALAAGWLAAQTGAHLSEREEDKLRETQDPGERIVVYLDFLQERLARFEAARRRPVDPKYDVAGFVDDLLADYIALHEEMKNWIEYQYTHNGDMRGGLKALLERGPHQLAELRAVQDSPDPYSSHYKDTLRDAINQYTDTLDGAAKALADQQKKFGELKMQAKEEERAAKTRAKEEAKRTKQDKKLRKRHGKGQVPGEAGED